MWQPEPGWRPLPAGPSASTQGLWTFDEAGRELVAKRLRAPGAEDPAELLDPRHPAYWRRAADEALEHVTAATTGLRSPAVVRVEEDGEGVTVVHERVAHAENTGLFTARALGRFAAVELGERPWLTQGQLRTRLRPVERRGGWTTLARTTVADVAHHLWTRREGLLARLDGLPQVAQHGDPVPTNLLGRRGEDVIAIDWSSLGRGPVGADLGYFSLSARESLEPLLTAYVEGLPSGLATTEQSLLAARAVAVFTVLTRADWALSRAAEGEGALAGKFRHPSVAPALQALQRQAPHIEALL